MIKLLQTYYLWRCKKLLAPLEDVKKLFYLTCYHTDASQWYVEVIPSIDIEINNTLTAIVQNENTMQTIIKCMKLVPIELVLGKDLCEIVMQLTLFKNTIIQKNKLEKNYEVIVTLPSTNLSPSFLHYFLSQFYTFDSKIIKLDDLLIEKSDKE